MNLIAMGLILTVILQMAILVLTTYLIRLTRHWAWGGMALAVAIAMHRPLWALYQSYIQHAPLPTGPFVIYYLLISSLLFVSFYFGVPLFRAARDASALVQERERQLDTLLRNLPGIAYRCLNDREWTMQYLSAGCLQLTGYQPSHLLHNNRNSFAHLIHKDDRERVWNEVQAAVQEKKSFKFTYRIHTADGQEKWVWEQGCGVYSPDGNLIALEGFITDITEHKQTEQRYRESEELLHQFADHLPDVFWLTNWVERKVVFVSKAYEAMWGRPCQSLIDEPKSWRDALYPADRERVLDAFETANFRKPFDIEYRIQHPTGRILWVHDRAYPIAAADGSIYRMAGFSQDITARKEIELALKAKQEEYQTVFNSVPAMIWYKDRHNNILRANESAALAMGATVREVERKSTANFFPDEAEKYYRDDLDVIESGQAKLNIVEPFRWANGAKGWCRTDKVPYFDSSGQVQGVIVFAQDITDLKRAEDAMRESEKKFRGAFDHAPIGVALVRKDGRFHQVNHRLCEMLGHSEAELLSLSFQEITHIDDVPTGMAALLEFLRGERDVLHAEKRYLHKNGEPVWVELSASPVYDEFGAIQYFVSQTQDITGRKKAERELRDSEQTFRSTFDNAPIGMAMVSAAGQFVRVNTRLCKMLGRSEDEVVGSSFHAFAHPEDNLLCHQILEDFRGGHSNFVQLEKRYMHRDGHIVWGQMSGSVVRDSEGQPIHFIIEIEDITDRKTAAEALRESEERYRTVTEAAREMIVVIDREDNVEFANKFTAEQFRTTVDQLVGRKRSEFFPAHVAARQAENLAKVFATGQPADVEALSIVNGRERWLDTRLGPLHDAKGNVRAVLGIARDITERRQAEQSLKRAQEYNRQIIEAIPGGLVHVTKDGALYSANAEAARLLGMSIEELTKRTIYDYVDGTIRQNGTPFPLEEYPVVKAIQTGEPQPPVTIGVRRPDGDINWGVYRAFPTRDPETDEITGATVTFLDLTEHMRAEDLRRERDRADAANQAKNTFLANVSHEIRTPLMGILAAAESLGRASVQENGGIDYRDLILRNGRHLLSLVNDLLDAARIESGKLEVQLQECSLPELFSDVQAVVTPLHVRREVALTFEFETDFPVSVRTDPIRLKQALINLVGNALKFTDEGFVRVRTSIVHESGNAYLVVAVEDTGIGIAASDLESIFQAFTQIRSGPERVAIGAGLGLSLAQWIAHELGGRLEVRSVVGEGSEFTLIVRLDVLDDRVALDRDQIILPPPKPEPPKLPTPEQIHGSILLAEDDPDVRLLVTAALVRCGADVVAVENGEEAVRAVEQREFDLIILDVRMPRMNGIEAVAAMRARRVGGVIIALTASTARGDSERLIKAGFDELWTKPIAMNQLVEQALDYLPGARATADPMKRAERGRKREVELAQALKEAAEEFRQTLSVRMQRIERAFAAGNLIEVDEALHQLTGTAATLGFPQVTSEARRLQIALANNPSSCKPSLLEPLREMIGHLS